MVSRFHFNPDTGRTGKCDAKHQCRFGQSEEQHGASREEARAHYEASMESELFANTKSKDETELESANGSSLNWPEPDAYDGAIQYAQALGLSPESVLFVKKSDEATLVSRGGKLYISFFGSSDFEEVDLNDPQNYDYISSLSGGAKYLRTIQAPARPATPEIAKKPERKTATSQRTTTRKYRPTTMKYREEYTGIQAQDLAIRDEPGQPNSYSTFFHSDDYDTFVKDTLENSRGNKASREQAILEKRKWYIGRLREISAERYEALAAKVPPARFSLSRKTRAERRAAREDQLAEIVQRKEQLDRFLDDFEKAPASAQLPMIYSNLPASESTFRAAALRPRR